MLILPCRIGRSLYLGREIAISVESIEGDEVRIAIDAPSRIRVSRDDISFRRHLQKQELLDQESADAPGHGSRRHRDRRRPGKGE